MLRVEIEHNGKTRRYDNTAGHTLVMGRSAKADYPLDEMGASNNHAEIEATSEGLRVKDCSQNGTGYVAKDGGVVRMAKGADTPMSSGAGLIIPYTKPGGGRDESFNDRVHWIRYYKTAQEPATGHAPLPLQESQCGAGGVDLPTTWPRSWMSLPMAVKEAWAREGIEDAQELSSFYTTESEVIEATMRLGTTREEAQQAAG